MILVIIRSQVGIRECPPYLMSSLSKCVGQHDRQEPGLSFRCSRHRGSSGGAILLVLHISYLVPDNSTGWTYGLQIHNLRVLMSLLQPSWTFEAYTTINKASHLPRLCHRLGRIGCCPTRRRKHPQKLFGTSPPKKRIEAVTKRESYSPLQVANTSPLLDELTRISHNQKEVTSLLTCLLAPNDLALTGANC